jgi:hypothetical protein
MLDDRPEPFPGPGKSQERLRLVKLAIQLAYFLKRSIDA